ncbi:tetratricopeptide repeat protein [Massilia sp. S19_KUP03_FR1]|uniref:tetratricopeptide repeat protein n=1 Tax=Massilia sp. S19_KUP03_FR1 TaxID=3025503 RepID=UPI002FCDAA0C
MSTLSETSLAASITWQSFASPVLGLVFTAPSHYQDDSDKHYFQVTDPTAEAQFTAAVYAGSAMDLATWAKARLGSIHDAMPLLAPVAAPKRVTGNLGAAVFAEYEGVLESAGVPMRYLVLCFVLPAGVASFSGAIPLSAWKGNETFYRDLMTERLSKYEVRGTSDEGVDLLALKLAAAAGDRQAQFVLASTLAAQTEDATSDRAVESVEWYRKAADQGHPDAQATLGVCYANGWGCTGSAEQAAIWWSKAAELGSARGHFALAVAFSQGFGLTEDDEKAFQHCRIAAEMGHIEAQQQLEQLRAHRRAGGRGDQ